MKTTNPEDVWSTSDENNTRKTQKQTRTGGIEPIIMDVTPGPDFEIKNGGSIIGKKSIRGDTINSDYLNIISENVVSDDI